MAELVSIVIPVFNREGMIVEAIESALAQTYGHFEVVVCDNASTDNTWPVLQKIAQRHSVVRVLRNEYNLGVFPNVRRCIEQSRGRLIKVLWSDDSLRPDAVARYVERLEPDVGCVFSSATVRVEGTGKEQAHATPDKDMRLSAFQFAAGQIDRSLPLPVSPGCALLRREDALRALLVTYRSRALSSVARTFGPDLFMFLVPLLSRPNAVWLKDALAIFRAHPGSITIAERTRAPIYGYLGAIAEFTMQTELPEEDRLGLQAALLVRAAIDRRLLLEWASKTLPLLESSPAEVLHKVGHKRVREWSARFAHLKSGREKDRGRPWRSGLYGGVGSLLSRLPG